MWCSASIYVSLFVAEVYIPVQQQLASKLTIHKLGHHENVEFSKQ